MIAINRCQLIIIPVQYNMAARLHGLEDFRLCFENSVSVAKIFQMTGSDICDHAGIRFRDPGKSCHFSKITDAHFQNGNLIVFFQTEYGQRQSEFIIKITLCFESTIFFFQYRCDHFFRAGLANASGNSDYRKLKLLQIKFCNVFYCLQRRCNLNIRIICVRKFSLGKCHKCTLRHDIRDKTMCINALSHDWYKQTVLLNLTAVCGNCRNLTVEKRIITMPDSVAHLCKIS